LEKRQVGRGGGGTSRQGVHAKWKMGNGGQKSEKRRGTIRLPLSDEEDERLGWFFPGGMCNEGDKGAYESGILTKRGMEIVHKQKKEKKHPEEKSRRIHERTQEKKRGENTARCNE